jgi:hypothetical protein
MLDPPTAAVCASRSITIFPTGMLENVMLCVPFEYV